MTSGRTHPPAAAERSRRTLRHRLGRPMLAVLLGGILLPVWAYQATMVRAATLSTEPAPVPCTLCVLSPTGAAMSLSGSSSVLVHWGSVVVDSSAAGAVSLSGSAEIQSSESEVVGGVESSGSPTISPSFDQVPAPGDLDPYAAMTEPVPASKASSIAASGNQTVTASPGTYSSIAASGNAVVTLQPGTYAITQSFAESGNAQVSGTGVTLFFSGQSGMALSGASTLHLTSPTSGTYAGISVFFDRSDTGSISSSGSASVSQRFFGGAVYAADGVLGGSGSQELEIDDPVVVRTVSLSGGGEILIDNLETAATVASASLAPKLGVTLTPSEQNATPGDTVTYSATASDTGAALTLSGTVTAANSDLTTATVASYSDALQTSPTGTCATQSNHGQTGVGWSTLAGTSATAAGYSPVSPGSATGMTLSLTPVAATGVTYPTSGDPMLGTRIQPGDTATWQYTATIALTPAQVTSLLTKTQVAQTRDSFHVEVLPDGQTQGAGQLDTVNSEFCQLFQAGVSGNVTSVSVTVTPPSGAAVTLGSNANAALASLAPGASATVTTPYRVPAVAAKGQSEADSAYVARLQKVEGSLLSASAKATGTAYSGAVSATPVPATVTEHVPVIAITKNGPVQAQAGTTATYSISVTNVGGATAAAPQVLDSLPDGTGASVSGVPVSLAPGAAVVATATYAIPVSQPAGALTDTAAAIWTDLNGDSYGPVSDGFTTQVVSGYQGATLTLSPVSAGPDVVGTAQTLTATFVDVSGQPIANQAISFAVTGANATGGSGTTNAAGVATFTYTGKVDGADTAQASFASGSLVLPSSTATVSWITPVEAVSSTTIEGNFFAEPGSATSFVAEPTQAPAFSQSFPDVDFNPPAQDENLPPALAGLGASTRPFTDVTANMAGAPDGSVVAQGDGVQAGVGALTSFDAVFTSTFIVKQAGDEVVNVIADDGFLLGVGGGATAVNGPMQSAPSSGTTPFDSYPLMAAWDQSAGGSPRAYQVTLDFPAAGSFAYELDYFSSSDQQLSLVVGLPSGQISTPSYGISAGYAVSGGQQAYQAAVAADDPIGYWPLSETSGTTAYDAVPGDLNGTIQGGVTLGVPGPIPGTTAMRFDGGNCSGINLDDAATALGVPFPTVEMWILTPDIPTSDAFLLRWRNYGYQLYATNTSVGLTGWADSNPADAWGFSGPGAINDGGWHYVVATTSQTGTAVYIDGQQVESGPGIAGTYFPYGFQAAIGMDGDACDGGNPSFPGAIADVAVYNHPLSGADVADHYAAALSAGNLPSPWNGAANTTFVGSGAPYDTGALRFDNDTSTPITLQHVTVAIGQVTYDPGFTNETVPANGSLILAGTDGNFDTARAVAPCTVSSVIPQVNVTVGGVTTAYADEGRALLGAGRDGGGCPGSVQNQSVPWELLGGPLAAPLPPAISLSLSPATSPGNVVGRIQSLSVTALDSSGQPIDGLSLQVGVDGANTQQLSAITGSSGMAELSYQGTSAGTDVVTVTASVSGEEAVSNSLAVPWSIPVPAPGGSSSGEAPSITDVSPSDGTSVDGAVPISAHVLPASGDSITSWAVSSQLLPTGAFSILASGSGTPPSPLASFDPSGLSPGTYAVTIAATAGGGSASVVTRLLVDGSPTAPGGSSAGGGTAQQAPPAVGSPTPSDGTVITAPTPISASITPPSGETVTQWSVTATDTSTGVVTAIASGMGAPPAPPAALGTFDPTLLPDGSYSIAISATGSGGGTQVVTTTVDVSGALKLGRYVTTYQDVTLSAGGLPLEVDRTYDSLNDQTSGDFGYGWNVSVSDFQVSVNRPLGEGGWSEYADSCFIICSWAYATSLAHVVTVTWPDGHQETFDFTPAGPTLTLIDFAQGTATFTARPGTGTVDTLTVTDPGSQGFVPGGDGNLYTDASGGTVYNPTEFTLTTPAGVKYVLSESGGLVSETDANGNTLTVDSTGIHSSNGQSVTYARDGEGRITGITDPAGDALQYSYDAAGDLQSVTDQDGNTTGYTYDTDHHLIAVTGPGGKPLQSETYDTSGRLVSITDAAGNTTAISNNVPGQQQTITDPSGKLTTILTMDAQGDVVREDQVSGGQDLVTTATYDSAGDPLTRTDPDGHTWTAGYDAAGDLTTLAAPVVGQTTQVAYDTRGDITSYEDAVGDITTYGYDQYGDLTSTTNPDGATQSFAYDPEGQLTSQTNAVGQTTTYSHDGAGHLLSTTDPTGGVTSQTVDADGRVLTSTDALGGVTHYTYDVAGNVLTQTDPDGNTTSYTYNAFGQVTSKKDADGGTTTYTYDSDQRLTAETDPLGRTTTYAYDVDSRLVSETDPAGATTTYSYDGFGRLASETDPLGRTTSYAYDTAGNLTSTTLPNGGVVKDGYDADGNLVSQTDAMGRTTSYAYDADGRLVSSTDPMGHVTSYAYDAAGQETAVTDPLGDVTRQAYNLAGELTSTTDPLGRATGYGYDKDGNQVTVTDPEGQTTTSVYDADDQLTAVTDPLGQTTSYGYDPDGRQTSVELPSGATTTSAYDVDGNLTSQTDAMGHVTSYTYDAAGEQVSMTDPLGATTTYGYDPDGRQTTETDALGGTVTTAYDADGEQLSVTNPDGQVSKETYDALGDVATAINPAGGVTTDSYDLDGELTSSVNPMGQTITSGYDADGLVTGQSFPGGTTSFGYDAAGRQTTMTDGTGTTTTSYDAASEVTQVASPEGTIGYAYTKDGDRSSMTLPGSETVSYGYDAAGELTQLSDWLGDTVKIGYDQDGDRTSIAYPGGVTSTATYNPDQEQTGVTQTGPSGTIASDAYTYDAAGNQTRDVSLAGTTSYSYDALNRLTGASYPNGATQAFTYDAAGNRTSETQNGQTTPYTYNAAGELTAVGSTAYAYDAGGDVTQAGSTSYAWNAQGDLTSTTQGGSTTSYTYDADGVRASATTGSATTSYLTDTEASLPQVVSAGGTSYVSTLDGQAVEQVSGSTPQYLLSDALGSVTDVTSGSGSVAGTAAYDAYGDQTAQTGASSIFGYAGQETDPTGLQYLRARYLDPASGSFLSPDTVQPNAPGTQGNDLYSYAGDNPTTATDPSGHAALAETGELEGIDVTAFLNDLEAAERVVSAPEEVLQQCAIVAVAQSEGVPAAVPAPPECAALTWLQKLMFLVVITGGATAVASSNPVPSPAGPAPNPSPTPSPKPSPQPGGTGGTQPPTAPPTAGGCTPKEVPEGMAPLPGDANVVRGGAAASQQPKVLEERAECIDDNGNLYGVSVNSAADMSLRSLAEAIPTDSGQPYKSVGSTTVEAIRQAGGDVVPDPQPNNPYHASVQGISAAKLSQLLLNGLTSVGTLPP